MIATPNTAAIENAARTFAPITASRGEISIHAEWSHISRILYSVPVERVRHLLPAGFDAGVSIVHGREQSLVSVTSFLDLGSRPSGQDAFEQTSYRLHATHAGKPVCWLLGASIGSLSAIAMRQMWQSPWHLGAMEFHARYSPAAGRYQEYELRTQSQWVNAAWAIADTGAPLDETGDQALLRAVQTREIADHFTRPDGSIGARRVRLNNAGRPPLTRGRMLVARCDLLDRLGLLTREELMQPALATMQHSMTCTYDTPQSDSHSAPQFFLASRRSASH